eukprot:2247556-Ditylum_brightwellii.AAC.1
MEWKSWAPDDDLANKIHSSKAVVAKDSGILVLDHLSNVCGRDRTVFTKGDRKLVAGMGPALFFAPALNIHFVWDVFHHASLTAIAR